MAALHPTITTELQPSTPLNLKSFAAALHDHPDKTFVAGILLSISRGADLRFTGQRFACKTPNAKSAVMHKQVVSQAIMKEVTLGHTIGPFSTPPLLNFVVNSLGIRSKKSGGHRLIMDLSQPINNSVNDHIAKENYSLTYARVDDAVRIITRYGPRTQLAKVDLKHAFRLCPVRKQDWHLLGFEWENKFFFDRVLPFGLRSAPYLFNQIADALEWIIRYRARTDNVIHYLDDFLTAGPPDTGDCQHNKDVTLATCSELGIPIAPEKVEGPSPVITFLGIELDTINMVIRLPADKFDSLLKVIPTWLRKSGCTKCELLSLIGTLSFACKCIPAGRMFLRRMIDLSTTTRHLHQSITLTQDFRLDIQWWQDFLPSWNGSASMLEPTWRATPDMELFMDASSTRGCGAYYQGHWFILPWSEEFNTTPPLSIEWKELFPILLSCSIWGQFWHGKRIMFHCDNEAIVSIWKKGSSRSPRIMALVRHIFFVAAQGNFHVMLTHIQGVKNCIADALSRSQVRRFRQLAPQADNEPTPLPDLTTFLPARSSISPL